MNNTYNHINALIPEPSPVLLKRNRTNQILSICFQNYQLLSKNHLKLIKSWNYHKENQKNYSCSLKVLHQNWNYLMRKYIKKGCTMILKKLISSTSRLTKPKNLRYTEVLLIYLIKANILF